MKNKLMLNSLNKENSNLFKSIFNNTENGICIVDYEGNIVELNSTYSKMFGYEQKELVGRHYSKIISDDSLPIVEENHLKALNSSNIFKAEEKVQHKNGTYFYIQTTNLRINDEDGNKLRITTAVDVTSRLRNELVQSVLLEISDLTNHSIPDEEFYSSIHKALIKLLPINYFSVCIKQKITGELEFPFVLDKSNHNTKLYLKAEHTFIESLGDSTILDKTQIAYLVNNGKLKQYNKIPNSILGIPLIIQDNFVGSIILKEYSKKTFTTEDKELLELVAGQITRVIERKNYENELIRAKQRAEEAVNIKSEFLAQISHEIRTPLNSILSFSSLIKNELTPNLTNELKEAFEYIERGGNRLTRTIDLILNVSKSQNNQYQIKLEDIDIYNEILLPLQKEFLNTIKKPIELIIEESEEVLRIVCDQYSVSQLFVNLIDNAIKYTEKGSIRIKAFQNYLGKIQVDITDTGIGISEKYLPNLFEPFSQEEQGYTRSYEGIGLGLSLVKSYAELNNAEIQVKSKKDIGSTFSVIFN